MGENEEIVSEERREKVMLERAVTTYYMGEPEIWLSLAIYN